MSDSPATDDDRAYERIELELERAQEFCETAARCLRAGVHMDPEAVRDAIASHMRRCIEAVQEW